MSRLAEKGPLYDRAWDALERGDLDGFTEVMQSEVHPDCVFRSGIGTVVGGGVYEGFDGVRTWFQDFLATTSERRWADREYEVHGDDVLIFLAKLSATGAASGAPVTTETGAVAQYQDGLCIRIDSFTSHDEAREFAGSLVA